MHYRLPSINDLLSDKPHLARAIAEHFTRMLAIFEKDRDSRLGLFTHR